METEIADQGSNGNGLNLTNVESITRISDHRIKDCDIPEWFLMEVLIRLPAMLVCRFKLVSKQWLSVISDPFFIRRINRLPQRWTIISCTMISKGYEYSQFSDHGLLKDIYSQTLKPRFCILPLPSTQKKSNGENYGVFAVSNGLVLYGLPPHLCRYVRTTLSLMHIYCICNPITGQWIALPPFNCNISKAGYGFLTHVEDSILKNYRVVTLEFITGRRNLIAIEVFFSETGYWNLFTLDNDMGIQFGSQRAATNLNGVLHWVSCKHGLIAYDPYKNPNDIRLIAFPSDMINRKSQNADTSMCSAYQGKLRIFEIANLFESAFPRFKVWVLNDYSSGDWCLQHEISCENVQYDVNLSDRLFFAPICFHPFDSDIVYLARGDNFVSYNIKTRKIEVEQEFLGNFSIRMQITPQWSDFLFMIPPWPVSIPQGPQPSFGAIDYKSLLM